MKVLMVHNFYQSSSPSGEDVVFTNEVELLKRNGVNVITYTCHNDEINNYSLWNKLLLPFNNIWSIRTYKEISKLIKKENPDIAHFHNIWYLISPSVYYACKEKGLPVIQSLHNQRIFCPRATIYRKEKICIKCADEFFPKSAVIYKCYRNSFAQTLILSIIITAHKILYKYEELVDLYVVFTEFFKYKFIEWGLPRDKIVVKPHFVFPDPGYQDRQNGEHALFIGRLDPEKGINTLIAAWKCINFTIPLLIRGEGRMQTAVSQLAIRNPSVKLIPRLSRYDLFKLIKSARFLIWPSDGWYENFGLVAIEAFACGVPLIASNTGAMAELIENGKTGLLFEPHNSIDLAEKIKWMIEHEDECVVMGKNARKVFEEKYTAERNFEILIDIYRKVCKI